MLWYEYIILGTFCILVKFTAIAFNPLLQQVLFNEMLMNTFAK